MTEPFFSIIIPTKNRPHFLEYAIKSVLLQVFQNFECIIVNNSDYEKETKAIFDGLVSEDKRFKYVRPYERLSMDKNWEFALNMVRGKYLTMLIDKVLLLPNCLSMVKLAIKENCDCEIFNWWSEAYNFHNEDLSHKGFYMPSWEFNLPEFVDSKKELKRRLNFTCNRTKEGRLYFRGKICFGFYKIDIVHEAQKRGGQFFYRYSPDYTSLISGLCISRKLFDLGVPGCISINTKLSNGRRAKKSNDAMLNFIKDSDPEATVLGFLPIKEQYASIHNFIAFDYLETLNKNKERYNLNKHFLRLRVSEDNGQSKNCYLFLIKILNLIILAISKNFVKKVLKKVSIEINRIYPHSPKTEEEIRHRAYCLQKHECSSPLDALQKAHSYYKNLKYTRYNLK